MNVRRPHRPIPLFVAMAISAIASQMTHARPVSKMAKRSVIRRQLEQSLIGAGANALEQRVQRVPTGAQIEVGFSPNPRDQALRLVLKIINAAHKTIEVAAYEMTSKPVSDALIRAAARGVQVFVVADAKVNDGASYSKVATMSQQGVHTRLDGLYPIMHNKFIVVDSTHVETGSYNYSYAAERKNAENVIVLWNNPALAALYSQRFNQLWAESAH